MSEYEMARWPHQCNEHELGHTLGDGEGQGGLACCSPSCHNELDITWQLNNKNNSRNNKRPSFEFEIIIIIYFINKIDKQQGPTIAQRTMLNIL